MSAVLQTISLLSDLGDVDESVGVLHAIIRDLAADVRVIDITHQIAPFDTRAASLALARATPYLPTGVVIVCVDAEAHRPIAVEVGGGRGVFVGPDNGVFAAAVAIAGGAERAVVLDDARVHLPSPGAVDVGRDVFVPAAVALCGGADLLTIGSPIDPHSLLPGTIPLPRTEGSTIFAEVLSVDRFGNCQLNVGPDDLDAVIEPGAVGSLVQLTVGDTVRVARVVDRRSDIVDGALGITVDRNGMMAISAGARSAAAELGVGSGTQVRLEASADVATIAPAGTASPVTFRRNSH